MAQRPCNRLLGFNTYSDSGNAIPCDILEKAAVSYSFSGGIAVCSASSETLKHLLGIILISNSSAGSCNDDSGLYELENVMGSLHFNRFPRACSVLASLWMDVISIMSA